MFLLVTVKPLLHEKFRQEKKKNLERKILANDNYLI